MAEANQTIAVFDMDRTITRHGTFTPFLLSTIGGRLWLYLMLPVVLVLMVTYRLGLITRKRLKEYMLGIFLRDASRDRLKVLVDRFVTRLLDSSTFPGALRQIEQHKAAGDRLVLATASMDIYVEVLAARLGFDMNVATQTEVGEAGRLTGRIIGENCYGAPKLDMVLAALPDVAAARDGFHVVAYSDHVSDAPLMGWANEAVAVNPSSGLRALAKKSGWEVVDWRE